MPLGFAVTDKLKYDWENEFRFDLVVHGLHFSLNLFIHFPGNSQLKVGDICYAGTGSTDEFEIVWDIFGNQIEPIAAKVPWMTVNQTFLTLKNSAKK